MQRTQWTPRPRPPRGCKPPTDGGVREALGLGSPAAAAPARPAPAGLQAAYNQLYQKHEALLAERARNASPAPASRVSDVALDAFVKTLLADPGVNMRFVPDAIEGAVYRNVLKMVLHSLAHASDTAGIELLGHHIRLVIEVPGLRAGRNGIPLGPRPSEGRAAHFAHSVGVGGSSPR
jgi:hypothetical protein